MQSGITVAAAHARPAVAEMLVVVRARGRSHERLLPDGPAAAGPGALRPRGRPAAFGVLRGRHGRRAADVPVRRRRGRGRGTCHQVFRAAGRKSERADGRGPALAVHGLRHQAVVFDGHGHVVVVTRRAA